MSFVEGWQAEHYMADGPFCDSTPHGAEILEPGSDDEHYDDPEERRRRIDAAAHRYLSGYAPVLLTAVLKGPFEGPGANGWVNPWSKSKRGPAPEATAPAAVEATTKTTINVEPAETDVSDAESRTSCPLPSPQSLDQAGATPNALPVGEQNLERVQAWRNGAGLVAQVDDEPTWSFASDISLSQSQSQRKRRVTGSDWLMRKEVKRLKSAWEDDIEVSSAVNQSHNQRLTRGQLSSQREMKQENTIEESFQSTPITQRQTRSSQRSSQRISNSTPRKKSPETPTKPAQVPEEQSSAPLSTPVQTPPSAVKTRVTPRTIATEQKNDARAADISTGKSRKNAKARVEFETQEDESFLFRARPRSRGSKAAAVDVTDNDQMETSSSSGLVSSDESESDRDEEAMDLDGDTFMADETKVTSPESSAEPENQKDTVQAITKPEKGITLQNAADMPAVPNGDSETPGHDKVPNEADVASNQHHQDETTEEESVSASQERTIVVQPASPEKKSQRPSENHRSSPHVESAPPAKSSTPVAPHGNQYKANQSRKVSMSQQQRLLNSLAQIASPQSPWSKDLLFTSNSYPASQTSWVRNRDRAPETPVTQQRYQLETPDIPDYSFRATPVSSQTPGPASRYTNETVQACGSNHRGTPLGTQRGEVVSQQESPAVPASQQSPWKADLPSIPPLRPSGDIQEASQNTLVDPGYQSPWTATPENLRLAAKAALVSKQFKEPKPMSPTPVASSTEPSIPKTDPPAIKEAPPPVDATPRPLTPEPVLEIKKFANFMSPSPERPKRKSAHVRFSGGHLPSTQNLLAATTDNPWDAPQRPVKRVTWAPEVKGGEDLDGDEPATPVVTRAASPPPDLAVADLPTDDKDKFHDHFQAVSRRTKITHRLLPSASQQFLESPEPMAMAEAFVNADSFGPRTPKAPEALMVANDTPLSAEQESQQTVDDVDEVLLNLNEFINMVDVEADLARAKEDERKEREEKEKQKQQKTNWSSGLFGRLSFSGLMDAGVWDS
ncbi:protamine p1 [Colletotrichum karsti]|uniref:Protamine p1 n=1 Tax=Colletotrichum karsti TaxID=1095194 RepID=A0A9P6I164_9PEZI|nr:protamine p1 [Colletotrichum karsti]KAF9874548.1 protamine p1 [Colletotrichum karsti]